MPEKLDLRGVLHARCLVLEAEPRVRAKRYTEL